MILFKLILSLLLIAKRKTKIIFQLDKIITFQFRKPKVNKED